MSPRSKIKKPIPHAFVLDELDPLSPWTRPMFGCTAVYVDQKIMLVLRDREDYPRDNGVWIATDREHHASLEKELPSMRSIEIFGDGPTHWRNLPATSLGFEEEVLRLCELIRRGDPRIGRIPKGRKYKKSNKLNENS